MVTSRGLAAVVAEALGVPGPTVDEHLRNLRKDGRIAFKGYGRGAARMGPRDAASLLLAAAGTGLVKDSLATLDAFGSLRRGRIGVPASGVTFLDHLAGLLTTTAAEGDSSGPDDPAVAFTLFSAAAGAAKETPPRFAVTRWGFRLRAATCFAPEGCKPVLTADQFTALLRGSGSGLVRTSVVTIEALEKVAASLWR